MVLHCVLNILYTYIPKTNTIQPKEKKKKNYPYWFWRFDGSGRPV